ncbi:MAG: hypothetical protein KDD50_09715 [Bdellovibrionales bacterium]|nr:hypothetical protein [Bdellovibrionales bacterium]
MSKYFWNILFQIFVAYFVTLPVSSTSCALPTLNKPTKCSILFESQHRQLWRDFNWTNPANHQKGHFIYQVHAIRGMSGRAVEEVIEFIEKSAADSDKLLSFSVIDDEHPDTMAASPGIILKVPYKNIIAADSEDLGLGRFERSRIFDWDLFKKDKPPLLSPQEMLKRTQSPYWNEAAATIGNTRSREKIEIIGIFTYPHVNQRKSNLLQKAAEDLSLPFVIIDP